MQPWTPETTGGIAETGILGVPWVPLVLYVGVLFGLTLVIHGLRGGTLRGSNGVLAMFRRSPVSRERRFWTTLLLAPVWVLPYWGLFALRGWDPVWAVDPSAPAPEVAEIRSDGIWRSDAIEHASSWSWTAGEPCIDECRGPRYIYRLDAGEMFTFVTTIRNDGPLPITLLGRPPGTGSDAGVGLALLRDPSVMSAEPSNLVPFEPVQLPAGATIPVALVLPAPPCANPDADVPRHDPFAHSYHGYPFVYEVLGWRRVGLAWPHVTVSVAGCE